jgi:hypothetical protein
MILTMNRTRTISCAIAPCCTLLHNEAFADSLSQKSFGPLSGCQMNLYACQAAARDNSYSWNPIYIILMYSGTLQAQLQLCQEAYDNCANAAQKY